MGPSSRLFGTGLVISQINMHALLDDCATLLSVGHPTGFFKARQTASIGDSTRGIDGLRITDKSQFSGNLTEIDDFPYGKETSISLDED